MLKALPTLPTLPTLPALPALLPVLPVLPVLPLLPACVNMVNSQFGLPTHRRHSDLPPFFGEKLMLLEMRQHRLGHDWDSEPAALADVPNTPVLLTPLAG